MLPHDEAGSGPAVILLHAGVADRSMWSETLPALAEAGYRAIAVDLPGFGDAAVQAGPQAPWNDVLQTMNELGIERAAIVGNSFGAAVALRVAVIAPARVSALMLVSTPMPGEPSEQLAAAWEAEEEAMERGDVEAAVEAVVEAWTDPGPVRERVAAMQRRAFELQLAAGDVEDAPDPVDEDPASLTRIDMPVLVAAGAGEMPDFLAAAETLARVVPGARSVLIGGARHLAPLEAPEAFHGLVTELLTLQ
ncbi:alpha/beta fold hydrolase [Candidatus Solirubrobacter pratensis]|uniref:alpha/beta fold hydrolase n=1 Tax=Candidatus Solirubrobacter pratensis TaxID=1298857 RepID=UPI0003FE0327|nr:alpha/beta fold hydrolase [Candidatus Solirubrobacter pratensis]